MWFLSQLKETWRAEGKEAKKIISVILGAIIGLVILAFLSIPFQPSEDPYHFISRMIFALGLGLVGLIVFVGVVYAFDWTSKGNWFDAIMDGNTAVAIVTGFLLLAVGVALSGAFG